MTAPLWPTKFSKEFLDEIRRDVGSDADAWVKLYQCRPTPSTDAEFIEAVRKGRARSRCGCPAGTVERVLIRHGTCGNGGCPYGGDF